MRLNPRYLFLVVALLTITSCGKPKEAVKTAPAAATPPSATSAAPAAGGSVIARYNGEVITDEDVRKVAGTKLAQAEMELYEARKAGLNDIIEGRLLDDAAKKQGTTKAELLKKQVYDKVKVDDKEIEKFFNEKKEQMQGKKLEDVKDNVKGFLTRDKQSKLHDALIADLKKNSKVEVLIKAPKVEVEEGENTPAIGPKDAPVKIVEWTDYQCPFCGRARAAVNQIMETYKGKVRYALRDFPLSFHKDAGKAHEAAHCAADQNKDKYWEFNKKLFADQKDIKVDTLKKYAGELKLNMDKFNQCLDSGKYTDLVQKNQEAGEKAGVSGTPAFFINGRMISGARPFEAFKEVIDDELESAK
jgi:protein-disulfide isomerase